MTIKGNFVAIFFHKDYFHYLHPKFVVCIYTQQAMLFFFCKKKCAFLFEACYPSQLSFFPSFPFLALSSSFVTLFPPQHLIDAHSLPSVLYLLFHFVHD